MVGNRRPRWNSTVGRNWSSCRMRQASEAVLDPAKGLRLICDTIERTMAKNQGRPRSAALLAASIDNMQSVRDLFGPSTRRTIFTPPDRAWRKYVWSARSIGRENIGYPVDGV